MNYKLHFRKKIKVMLPFILTSICFSITTKDVYSDSWAIIIGINEYQNVKPLNYAVSDAQSIKEILLNNYKFKDTNIAFITDENATKDNILDAFSNVSKQAKEKDRIVKE